MHFADRVRSFLPFLRSSPRLPATLTRGLHPARNPAASWSREGTDGNVVILAPRPPSQGLRKMLAKFIGEPAGRRIELSDEMASFVWELCDGQRTVAQICSEVSAEYKLGERQTEISVLQFLNMLRSRRLVGLPAREQLAIQNAVKSGPTELPRETGSSLNHGNSHPKPRRSRARSARRH